LIRHPFITFKYFTIVSLNTLVDLLRFTLSLWYVIVLVGGIVAAAYLVDGPHKK